MTSKNPQADVVATTIGGAMLLVAGTMIASLPFWTAFWVIAGLLPAFGLAKLWQRVKGRSRKVLPVAAAAILIGCCFMAYREYIGANYRLKYKVCGDSYMEMADGYLDGVLFGIEWVNENNVDLYVRLDNRDHSLTAADRSSILPMPDLTTVVHPSEDSAQDPKTTDAVKFNPPLTPPDSLAGHARYKLTYGKDPKSLYNELTIEGDFQVLFNDDGSVSAFRYTPGPASSTGYLGMCDIRRQKYGRETLTSP